MEACHGDLSNPKRLPGTASSEQAEHKNFQSLSWHTNKSSDSELDLADPQFDQEKPLEHHSFQLFL